MVPMSLMLVGSGLSAYSNIRQGESRADSLIADAMVKNDSANEIMRRSLVNQGQIRDQSEGKQAKIRSAYAASGVQLSGSTLDVLETVALQYDREIANKHIEDSFRASQLRREATSQLDASDDAVKAGYIGALSSVAGGLYDYKKSGGNFYTKRVDE